MTYEVIGHENPRKPIDLRGRKKIITKEDVLNGTVREPDLAAYTYYWEKQIWILKE